jgi:hypothetical protein
MEKNNNNSKEQIQQARENKQAKEDGLIRDKKLEGPNRPSV